MAPLKKALANQGTLNGLGSMATVALGPNGGACAVDRNVFNNVRLLGASERHLTRHVLLPSALTWILTSLHTSVGFAMVGAVVGEYLEAARGLGHVIAQSERNLDATGAWIGMVVVVAVEVLVTQLEARLVPWKPQVVTDVLAP